MSRSVNRDFTDVKPQYTNEEEWMWVKFDDGSMVRMHVYVDSNRAVGLACWLPYWCPQCVVNNHAKLGIRHAFEYIVKSADGKLEAWCELCARYFEYAKIPTGRVYAWVLQ